MCLQSYVAVLLLVIKDGVGLRKELVFFQVSLLLLLAAIARVHCDALLLLRQSASLRLIALEIILLTVCRIRNGLVLLS